MANDSRDRWTTRESEITRDGDVYIIDFKQGSAVDLEEAQAQVRSVYERAGGERFRLLADLTGNRSQTKEARDFYSSDETGRDVIALALVSSSQVGRMIGNFFFGLNRLAFPARLFPDREQALAWLKAQPVS
jgi:stage II sporulation SpoAA-like protein